MTIRRIFPNTRPINDFESFRQRAINLYREWLREIPRAVQKYPLDITVPQGRARVRQEFQFYATYFSNLTNEKVDKLAIMSGVLLKGTNELIEVHNRWSQKTHVMRWFEGVGERKSPAILASNSDKQVKSLNEGISKVDISPFLQDFLTANK